MGYIDLGYTPHNDVVCHFRVRASDIQKAAEDLAKESSVGTWTEIKDIPQSLAAHVFSIEGNDVKVAYPAELFESGNICQILSCVAGNIFGMKSIDTLRLEDMEFPPSLVRGYGGPRYGVEGIRRMMRIRERPLIGTIIKPKVGLSSKKHAEVAFEAFMGGCDIVKDDENLTNQKFNPFKKRVARTIAVQEKAEDKTGEKKAYMPNISAEFEEMVRRAEYVCESGGKYAMIDVVIVGFSALQGLRRKSIPLPIHAHRAMHAAFTRSPLHGISMLVLSKIYRMIGVDQLHIGTIVGKMEGAREDILSIHRALNEKMKGKRKVFSVLSGGLHPGNIRTLVDIFGNDIIMQFGGGIHGHPWGTRAGAKACRQALDAALEKRNLTETKPELGEALRQWRTSD
jgi:ribulose-bisphosphate carboxylase large chain